MPTRQWIPSQVVTGGIEQGPELLDHYFSGGDTWDIHHFDSNESVPLYEIFSADGDEELGNDNQTNGPLKAPSPGVTNMTADLENDAIPIDLAILEDGSTHENAHIIKDPQLVPDTDPALFDTLQTIEKRTANFTEKATT
ncbi:hypothetical protein ZTR_11190 [Talaromyces verruculosus]|nr:hypothetical protein ZTR_11190 [Talaromyces verruculosus]